ncbi:hypothetical protein Tco_1213147 [Tanacetum coccineum]
MVEHDDEIKVLGKINLELQSSIDKVIKKLSLEKVSQVESLEKFNWKVVCDHEIKVLQEVQVELESSTKKLREKLSQEEDTKEEAFEDFSSSLDTVLVKLSQENDSPYDFYGLKYDTDNDASTKVDWQDDPLHATEDLFVGLDQPIQVVVAQNNVHVEVAEKVIEIANDQAEALSSNQEVTDESMDDKHVVETRLSKRIRVTQEEMVKYENRKKG